MFIKKVKQGDVILVAQGANWNKEVFICGEVTSEAIKEHISDTPYETFNRKLKHIVPKEWLEKLQLNFESAAYGDSNQPNAIYRLYPESNPADLQITTALQKAINQVKEMESLQQVIKLLELKSQIILQGPPGTGKTYKAKQLVHQLVFGKPLSVDKEEHRLQIQQLKESGQMELIQFHPSYSYEDFVRGITAETKDNAVYYKTKNKVLADFAGKAWKNLQDRKKDSSELSKEEFFDTKFEQFHELIEKELQEIGPIQLTPAVRLTRIDEDAFVTSGQSNWPSRLLFSQIRLLYLLNITTRD